MILITNVFGNIRLNWADSINSSDRTSFFTSFKLIFSIEVLFKWFNKFKIIFSFINSWPKILNSTLL